MEENSGHFSNLVNLAVNSDGVNKHEFSANLTHAQARVDVMVIKATKENDSYSVEDVNPFQMVRFVILFLLLKELTMFVG